MRLAAHLCGERCVELLAGDDSFVAELPALGFGRVQVNATAVNGVDTDPEYLASRAPVLAGIMRCHENLVFIVQRSEETRALWEPLGEMAARGELPNLAMLFDESKGTGARAAGYEPPPGGYPVGYAGGLGPGNLGEVLDEVLALDPEKQVWVDMESGLRGVLDGEDVFDLNKVERCVRACVERGILEDPLK